MNRFGSTGRGARGRSGWQTVMAMAGRQESEGTRRRRRARSGWGRRPEQDALDESRDTLDDLRPRTRRDCREGIRPCPFLSCEYHTLNALIAPKDGGPARLDLALLAKLDETNSCHLDVAEGLVAPFDK